MSQARKRRGALTTARIAATAYRAGERQAKDQQDDHQRSETEGYFQYERTHEGNLTHVENDAKRFC